MPLQVNIVCVREHAQEEKAQQDDDPPQDPLEGGAFLAALPFLDRTRDYQTTISSRRRAYTS